MEVSVGYSRETGILRICLECGSESEGFHFDTRSNLGVWAIMLETLNNATSRYAIYGTDNATILHRPSQGISLCRGNYEYQLKNNVAQHMLNTIITELSHRHQLDYRHP